ncbi:PTS sugar transporter subunit IIB [Bacillus sp. AFS023182]|uniref:PTS sugar transporter subunit IIB n=1 Tax=unclassified Bacillus (in: firmicutes) TaxID=185979 RepID=UPI00047D7F69|nr:MULTISPECIES: PTS sugar transporter subunit IIB [unclassified Bacillus (in: firmicutes)]PFD97529.1 PTS sugar transporter subunit IIB [Bacillus sp. AFS023182]
MKKIVLLCNAGMSTSMLMNKMRGYAEEINYECEINAYPLAEAKNVGQAADIILLGPQVRYALNTVKGQLPEKLIEVIDMSAYGMLDGKKVIEQVKNILGD